jgi:hypothetical protein
VLIYLKCLINDLLLLLLSSPLSSLLQINLLLFLKILLAYNSSTWRIHYDICLCAYNKSWLYLPPLLFSLFNPLLDQFQSLSFFYFHIWIFNPPALHLLKCILIVQGGFALVHSDQHKLCFNQISTPVTYSFFVTMLH